MQKSLINTIVTIITTTIMTDCITIEAILIKVSQRGNWTAESCKDFKAIQLHRWTLKPSRGLLKVKRHLAHFQKLAIWTTIHKEWGTYKQICVAKFEGRGRERWRESCSFSTNIVSVICITVAHYASQSTHWLGEGREDGDPKNARSCAWLELNLRLYLLWPKEL